jgi:predicted NodU family carbamoyl transferase|tara:strand:+ start:13 stop:228 length:216 start_codon:yes stop_codon:yes gene_type:complete
MTLIKLITYLIYEFYKISGIPAILNTSLNLHSYSISPEVYDIFKTLRYSVLEYLFLENKFLIIKKINYEKK